MAARSDLVGQRFGALLIVARADLQPGKPAWRCVCDCGGAEEVLRQYQLTERGITACAACRQPRCVTCGRQVPAARGRKNTCSDACAKIKYAANSATYNARSKAADPDFYRRKYRAKLADPQQREQMANYNRQRDAKRWEQIKNDPEALQAARRRVAAWYAANADRVQAQRKARVDAMDSTKYAAWAERARGYQRAYRARWREHIEQHPELHRKYLDYLKEYRRQQALRGLLEVGGKLMDKYDLKKGT